MSDETDEFQRFAVERSGPLFRTALLLCGDWHLAEDLVQTTLAKLYRSWTRVASARDPAAYARATLLRFFLAQRRLRSSHEKPAAFIPDREAASEPDPALRVALMAAMARLDAKDRAVLVLRYWDDTSVEDTAAVLGLSASAVRTRSRRALAKLRVVFGEEHADPLS